MTKNKNIDMQLLPKIIAHCNEVITDINIMGDVETFANHQFCPRASAQSLAQIGELIKRLSDTTTKNPDYNLADWKGMARFRDKISHGYGSLEWEHVWNIMNEDVPAIKNCCIQAYKDLSVSISEKQPDQTSTKTTQTATFVNTADTTTNFEARFKTHELQIDPTPVDKGHGGLGS
jgi:uncharacterized protein with HEPN domain